MKVGICMMSHETNTFSPVVTDLQRFSGGQTTPPSGTLARDMFTGTATCLGGYIKVATERGAELQFGIAAGAAPSGRVENEAFEFMCREILEVASRSDALLLDLHGAMATKTFDDGEGELLARVRGAHPTLPIGVSLDMHANVTRKMVENCSVLAGYHTYPHIDMDATAERAANMFFDMLEGKTKPVMYWAQAPMLPHVMRQGTDDFPNDALQQRAQALEADACVGVSVFTGFPHADIYDAGLSVVVVADENAPGDAEINGKAIADELLDFAWLHRERFVYEIEPLQASMSRAEQASSAPGAGPVILLDHYDNTASGGTMDTTEVLAAILDTGLRDVAVFGIYDPDVVQQMIEAGVGATLTVQLGGKLPASALSEQSKSLEVTGEVKLLSNGKFAARVAMSRGLTIDMGPAAVLTTGDVDIAIISKHIEPYDPECFRCLGMEPTQRRYLMLKSRIHYRVGFMPIAKQIVECAGRGVCTSDYNELTFEHVRRPIFPLDQNFN